MARPSWLKHLFANWSDPRGRTTKPRRVPTIGRTPIEGLEDRVVPATFTVTNLNETGAGSLRQALADANASPGADEVRFTTAGTINWTGGRVDIRGDLTLVGPGAGALTLMRAAGTTGNLLFVNPRVTATISGMTFAGGNDLYGGAIDNRGTLTVTDSVVRDNTARERGAGIYNEGGTLTVARSLIVGNTSQQSGGGVYNTGGTLTLINDTITANAARNGSGGGVFSDAANRATVHSSTIVFNTATAKGGGLYGVNGTVVNNTILFGNKVGTVADDGTNSPGLSGSNNVVGDAGTGGGLNNGQNGNKLGVDPKLGELTDNGGPTKTYALRDGSPARDAGNATLLPAGVATDQRGQPRVQGALDVGAVEGVAVPPPPAAPSSKTFTVTNTNDGGPGSLRQAVYDANTNPAADVIQFDAALSGKTIGLGSGLTVQGTDLTIAGPGSGLLTITRAANATGSFSLLSTGGGIHVTITGLTLAGGSAVNGGALNNAAQTVLNDVVMKGNAATGLGGAAFNTGDLTVVNSLVQGNAAESGGGLDNAAGGVLKVRYSSVVGNTARLHAGGVFNQFGGTLSMDNATVSGNAAAGGYGGGVANDAPNGATLVNLTIAGNRAGAGGGGLTGAATTVHNTIVAGNTANGQPNDALAPLTGFNNLIGSAGTAGGLQIGVNGNKVGIDPRLGPLQDNGGPFHLPTHALLDGSPARDAGNGDRVPAGAVTDQRGEPRLRGAVVDVGAVEAPYVESHEVDFGGLRFVVATPFVFNKFQDSNGAIGGFGVNIGLVPGAGEAFKPLLYQNGFVRLDPRSPGEVVLEGLPAPFSFLTAADGLGLADLGGGKRLTLSVAELLGGGAALANGARHTVGGVQASVSTIRLARNGSGQPALVLGSELTFPGLGGVTVAAAAEYAPAPGGPRFSLPAGLKVTDPVFLSGVKLQPRPGGLALAQNGSDVVLTGLADLTANGTSVPINLGGAGARGLVVGAGAVALDGVVESDFTFGSVRFVNPAGVRTSYDPGAGVTLRGKAELRNAGWFVADFGGPSDGLSVGPGGVRQAGATLTAQANGNRLSVAGNQFTHGALRLAYRADAGLTVTGDVTFTYLSQPIVVGLGKGGTRGMVLAGDGLKEFSGAVASGFRLGVFDVRTPDARVVWEWSPGSPTFANGGDLVVAGRVELVSAGEADRIPVDLGGGLGTAGIRFSFGSLRAFEAVVRDAGFKLGGSALNPRGVVVRLGEVPGPFGPSGVTVSFEGPAELRAGNSTLLFRFGGRGGATRTVIADGRIAAFVDELDTRPSTTADFTVGGVVFRARPGFVTPDLHLGYSGNQGTLKVAGAFLATAGSSDLWVSGEVAVQGNRVAAFTNTVDSPFLIDSIRATPGPFYATYPGKIVYDPAADRVAYAGELNLTIRGTPSQQFYGVNGVPLLPVTARGVIIPQLQDQDISGSKVEVANLAFTFAPGGAITYMGSTELRYGDLMLRVHLGNAGTAGLVVQDQRATAFEGTVEGGFRVGGAEVVAKDLRVSYDAAAGTIRVRGSATLKYTQVAGEAALEVQLGGAVNGRTTDGLVIVNGQLQSLDATVTAGFAVSGVEVGVRGLRVTYDRNASRYTVSGGATLRFSVGASPVTVNVELGEGKYHGLVIEQGRLKELLVKVSSSFTVAGLQVEVIDLGALYVADQRLFAFAGTVKLTTAEQGAARKRVLDHLTVQLGTSLLSAPGIRVVDGKLTDLDVAVTASLNLGGLNVAPDNLRVRYTRDSGVIQFTGLLKVSLQDRFTAVLNLPGDGITIDANTGRVRIRGVEFTLSDVKIGQSFELHHLRVFYVEDGQGGYSAGGEVEVSIKGHGIRGAVEIQDGKLKSIRLGYFGNPGITLVPGLAYLTGIDGRLENLNDLDKFKITATGSLTVFPSYRVGNVTLDVATITGTIEYDNATQRLTISGESALFGRLVSGPGGRLVLDLKKNEIEYTRKEVYPVGLGIAVEFTWQFHLAVPNRDYIRIKIGTGVALKLTERLRWDAARIELTFELNRARGDASFDIWTDGLGPFDFNAVFWLAGPNRGRVDVRNSPDIFLKEGWYTFPLVGAFKAAGEPAEFLAADSGAPAFAPGAVSVLGAYAVPGTPTGEVRYDARSNDPDATVNLYADDDANGYDGQLIASGLPAGAQTWTWADLASYAGLPSEPGRPLYVYAEIDDRSHGGSPSAYSGPVIPPNYAPTAAVPGPREYAPTRPVVFSAAAGTAVTVADPLAAFDPTTRVEVTLDVADGTLTLPFTMYGVDVEGNGTDLVTLGGTATDINAVLDGLRYDPLPGAFFDDALEVTVGRNGTAGTTTTVALRATPLTLTDPGVAALTYLAGSPATTLLSNVVLADAASQWIDEATVRVDNFEPGVDELGFLGHPGIEATYDPVTGVLVLSGVADVVAYQEALRAVTFGSASAGVEKSLTVTVGDDHGDVASLTLPLLGETGNHAPAVGRTGFGPVYLAGDGGAYPFDGRLTLADADGDLLTGAVVRVVEGYVAGVDELEFEDTPAVRGVWDAAAGTLTLTGTATEYAAALRYVNYFARTATPAAGPRTLTVTVTDGTAEGTGLFRVLVADDTSTLGNPAVTLPTPAAALDLGAAAVPVAPDLDLTAPNTPTLVGATVSLIGGFSPGEDFLAARYLPFGITASYDATAGQLTLMGVASAEDYTATLRAVEYENHSSIRSGAQRVVVIAVDDGLAPVDAAFLTLTVAAAPVVEADAPALVYTTGKTAAAVSPRLDVDYRGGPVLTGATVAFTGYYNPAEDRLVFADRPGIRGAYDPAAGVLTLSGRASAGDYEAALRSVAYLSLRANPTPFEREVTFAVTAGAVTSTGSAGRADIHVAPDEVAPTVAGAGGAVVAAEAGAPPAVFAGLTLADPDAGGPAAGADPGPAVTGATVRVAAGFAAGEDVLDFIPAAGITGDYFPATGELYLTGAASLADYAAVLRSVTYRNVSRAPTAGPRSVEFVLDTGAARPAAASTVVLVASLNDAPETSGWPVADVAVPTNGGPRSLGLEGLNYTPPAGMGAVVVAITAVPDEALGRVLLADGAPAVAGMTTTVDQLRGAVFAPAGVTASGTGRFAYTVAGVDPATGRTDAAVRVEGLTVTVVPRPAALAGVPEIAVGAGAGTAPTAQLLKPDGTVRLSVTPFEASFTGGVRTAAADFNADGVADLVVGSGPGRPTQVRVFDGATGAELFNVAPFERSFTGGVFVAAGDLDGDGKVELVVTPDQGGGPRVLVYQQWEDRLVAVASFFGIDDPNFRGGARAAVGDVDGDGVADLVVAAGFGGGPRVAGYEGRSVLSGRLDRLFHDFFVFEPSVVNGAFVAAGDVDGDGFADVVAGGGPTGGPRVRVLSGRDLLAGREAAVADFLAAAADDRAGADVAVKDLDGDGKADVVAAAGGRTRGVAGARLAAGDADPALDLALGGVYAG